jgi:RNA polymerase sigma factor (TIGR02999 family)
MGDPSEITRLIQLAGGGDEVAASALAPLIYGELRATALARMQKIPLGVTLQPTALVHEAWLRVMGKEDVAFEGRRHFFFAAARAMHDILVEDARAKMTKKRGGDRQRFSAEQIEIPFETPAQDMLALSKAMESLREEQPRAHELVMLRFFAGISVEEAAEVLEVSVSTAEREWRFARAFLHTILSGEEL